MRISDWSSDVCSSDLGHDVVCVDNLLTGSKNNIRHLNQHNRLSFEFIRHDITQPLNIQGDEIYNMACPASPPQYQHNPIYTLKTSVLGALNVLELARETKARILQASTYEVYGDPALHTRSAARRVGNGCVSTGRSRWSPST